MAECKIEIKVKQSAGIEILMNLMDNISELNALISDCNRFEADRILEDIRKNIGDLLAVKQ